MRVLESSRSRRSNEHWSVDVSADFAVENSNALLPLNVVPHQRNYVQREVVQQIILSADMEVGQYGLGNQHRGPVRAG